MNNAQIRELRFQWSQCIQDGNQLWTERKIDSAEKSFRKAFNLAKTISRKTGKPDVSVEITLKTMTEFYRAHGNYINAAFYYSLTRLWYVERWFKQRNSKR